MKLNKKQEEAVEIAIRVMESVLDKGIDNGKDGKVEFAIYELIAMKNKSITTKLKEKAKRRYLNNLFNNSNTIILDSNWYDKNIKKS